jgi:hypothetical protein
MIRLSMSRLAMTASRRPVSARRPPLRGEELVRAGSNTAPATISPSTARATEAQKNGYECAKFTVPSRGSMNQTCRDPVRARSVSSVTMSWAG